MDDCVFCKILRGELPCKRVAETRLSFAFMDIMPVSEGHTLVIPRKHVGTIGELGEEELADLFGLVQRVSTACEAVLGASGTNLLQCNGEVAGQVVPHLHVHVIPRREGDGIQFHPPQREVGDGEINRLTELLAEELSKS